MTSKTRTDNRSTAKRALTLIEAARGPGGVPSYGMSPLLADAKTLRAHVRLDVASLDLHAPSILDFPDERGYRTLYLRAGLPLESRRFLELYETGRILAGFKGNWDAAAVVFALAGVLNLRDCLLRPGGWRDSVLRQLGDLDPVWGITTLPHAASVAQALLLAEPPIANACRKRAAEARETFEQARAMRDSGQLERAEDLFQACVAQAAKCGDVEIAALALIGRAHIQKRLHNPRAAGVLYRKALALAEREGLQSVRAKALHDLFLLAAERHADRQARDLARAAFSAYEQARLPDIHRLAFDIAYHWVLLGDHGCALPVIGAVLPHVEDDLERLLVLSVFTWAAAGSGRMDVYAPAMAQARALSARSPEGVRKAEASLAVASAAMAAGDWVGARALAEGAAELAARVSDYSTLAAAGRLLERARSGRLGTTKRARASVSRSSLGLHIVRKLGAPV